MNVAQTRLAEMETLATDVRVIRLKENIKIDNPGIRELIQVAAGLSGDRLSVVTVIPADADFDISVMRYDHGGSDRIKVMAFVSDNAMIQCMVELYLRYFPQTCPVRVFARLQDALDWVREHPEHRSVA